MSTAKHFDRIACAALALALVLTLLFANSEALGLPITAAHAAPGYVSRLFDTSRVHTLDIVMDDWDGFLATCENEEYSPCAVVIDGDAARNVAIRAKGNTSLRDVARYGNDRYSFKIEFDHYDSANTWHGLDKLSLNNLISDDSMLKDYTVYQLMNEFGVAAPLCSYVWVTVNGADWGLYLAVEAVEDAFLARNYGNDAGELYKPDSADMGGGRGNGRDFDADDFRRRMEEQGADLPQLPDGDAAPQPDAAAPEQPDAAAPEQPDAAAPEQPDAAASEGPQDTDPPQGAAPDGSTPPELPAGEPPADFGEQPPAAPDGTTDFAPPNGELPQGTIPQGGDRPQWPNGERPQRPDGEMPWADGEMPQQPDGTADGDAGFGRGPGGAGMGQRPGGMGGDMGGDRGGMGGGPNMAADDVLLRYSSDDAADYPNIFDNAKTDVTAADEQRLLTALKTLNGGTDADPATAVDTAAVLRYFVVHGFVCNGDSYTGSIVHNYYLHEQDGRLSMIPWDYNLAFGGFGGGSTAQESIAAPVSSGTVEDRPMLAWIFADTAYTEQYYTLYQQFIDECCADGRLAALIDDTAALIAPYVERDPTKFCTTDAFTAGVEQLQTFCADRLASVQAQLSDLA